MTQVLHIITGLADGGAEAVLYRLCTASNQHRYIVISLMDDGKYGLLLNQAGITVHALGMPRGRLTFSGLWQLWRLLRRERPDLVQTWMYHADLVGGLIALLAGIRLICWGIHHGNLDHGKSSRSTIFAAHLSSWLSRWVPSKIISCSQSAARLHEELGYDAQRMIVIPNGCDLTCFQPNLDAGLEIRRTLGLVTDRPLIGLVARFDPLKNHAGLLAAFARVLAAGYGCDLALIGTGIDRENATLNDWISAHDLYGHVHLLGQRNDIPALMNALDLHVLSSCGESFGNVLIEAMACGTPCVTTDVGVAALIVGETGWVVPPDDPYALAGAILQALHERKDVARWAARKAAARERIVTQFSLDVMVRAYEEVWRTCLES